MFERDDTLGRLAAHPSTSSAVSSISEEDLNGAVHRPMVSNQCEPPAPQRVKVAPMELVQREQQEIHSSESDDQSGTIDSEHFALTSPWGTFLASHIIASTLLSNLTGCCQCARDLALSFARSNITSSLLSEEGARQLRPALSAGAVCTQLEFRFKPLLNSTLTTL